MPMARPRASGYHRPPLVLIAGGTPMAGLKPPIAVFFLTVVLALTVAGGAVLAAESPFAGYEMTEAAAHYVVITDANVRAKPETKSAKVTVLRKGTRFESVGRPKGTEWISVRRNGEDVGFVYKTVVAPVIDGEVKGPITGKLAGDGRPSCDYTLTFSGKFKVPNESQRTADYNARFTCKDRKTAIAFKAAMFVTELPYLDTTKHEFQINVDVLGVLGAEEDEGIFSVISVYRLLEKKVVFDSITEPELGSGAKIAPKPADGVRAALIAAVEIAHAAWGPKLWIALTKS